MKPIELFEIWAPEGAPWSPWAKPVLFAVEGPIGAHGPTNWNSARNRAQALRAPPASTETALVLDLDGPLALAYALGCAARGARPVPLFNSCTGPAAAIDNESLRAGLEEGAAVLRGFSLASSAPPAFVLDARRTAPAPATGFDNRWVVFPQDFPSAARLAASGIRRALLVQEGRRAPREDLAHVLLRWQQAGIEILALDLASEAGPEPITVKRPSLFRAFGYRVLVALGLSRNSAGGFGAAVPQALSGGSWGSGRGLGGGGFFA